MAMLDMRDLQEKENPRLMAGDYPRFRCPSCRENWDGHPCMTTCRFCGNLYVEWVNFAEWRAHPARAEYRKRLGE